MIGGGTAIMHEMSIAGSMLEAVTAESARHNAHVLAVGVKIGELSGLDARSRDGNLRAAHPSYDRRSDSHHARDEHSRFDAGGRPGRIRAAQRPRAGGGR